MMKRWKWLWILPVLAVLAVGLGCQSEKPMATSSMENNTRATTDALPAYTEWNSHALAEVIEAQAKQLITYYAKTGINAAYLNTGEGLLIWDVRDPLTLIKLDDMGMYDRFGGYVEEISWSLDSKVEFVPPLDQHITPGPTVCTYMIARDEAEPVLESKAPCGCFMMDGSPVVTIHDILCPTSNAEVQKAMVNRYDYGCVTRRAKEVLALQAKQMGLELVFGSGPGLGPSENQWVIPGPNARCVYSIDEDYEGSQRHEDMNSAIETELESLGLAQKQRPETWEEFLAQFPDNEKPFVEKYLRERWDDPPVCELTKN